MDYRHILPIKDSLKVDDYGFVSYKHADFHFTNH